MVHLDADDLRVMNTVIADIGRYETVYVAFSGGVDSSVVAALAYRALGDRATAVTAQSSALATGELDQAQTVAEFIGIRHLVLNTTEIEDPNYRRNPINRCYFCKKNLYGKIQWHSGGRGTILSGTNHDDLDDWRPGLTAASEAGVHHPLAAANVTKAQVRSIATFLRLPNADKPASPCLASRVPYGTPVTIDLLRRVDTAEMYVRRLGFQEFRVRHHRESATVELSKADLDRLTPESSLAIIEAVQSAGYRLCHIASEPLHSGRLNRPRRNSMHDQ